MTQHTRIVSTGSVAVVGVVGGGKKCLERGEKKQKEKKVEKKGEKALVVVSQLTRHQEPGGLKPKDPKAAKTRVFSFFFFCCSSPSLEDTDIMEELQKLPEYSWEEIRNHADETSCWCVMYGLVYDLTKFLHVHPGTAHVLLEVGGQDATEAFEDAGHSLQAQVQADEFLIGRLKGVTDIRKCQGTTGQSCSRLAQQASGKAVSSISFFAMVAIVALVGIWLYFQFQEDEVYRYPSAPSASQNHDASTSMSY
ncbi:hypothetical protein Esti_003918 [Eimeria stiedai]